MQREPGAIGDIADALEVGADHEDGDDREAGLTEAEIAGPVRRRPGFLDRLAEADPAAFALPSIRPDLVGYIDLAVRGGFPSTARPTARWPSHCRSSTTT